MPRKKRIYHKYGFHPIGYEAKRPVRSRSTGEMVMKPFHLEDRVSNRATATVIQLHFQTQGYYCHIQPVPQADVYYIWKGPKTRINKPRLIPGDVVQHPTKKGHMRLLA